jgi:hypothetical protein
MKKLFFYLSRIVAIAIVLFFGAFIFEGFAAGFSWVDSIRHLVITLLVLAATIVAWRNSRTGGWLFIILGILCGLYLGNFQISGVMILTGILFLLSGKKSFG